MRRCLEKVLSGQALDEREATLAFASIMDGEATAAQIGAFLAALRVRGEAVEEVVGGARALRSRATRIPVPPEGLVDTCGTGGDGKGSFNISTAAALVAAAGGARVAKHGNVGVSSASGSADCLRELGVDTLAPPATVARCILRAGVGFLYARELHPAMARAAPIRRELGVRTVFNLLGPLANPAGASRQLLGVYHASLVLPMARVLSRLGAERALVVHGAEGLDEVSAWGPTIAAEVRGEEVREWALGPEDFGLSRDVPDVPGRRGRGPWDALAELRVEDPVESARRVLEVLEGRPGMSRDVVVVNAAAALYVAGIVPCLEEGARRARDAIDRGRAMAVLDGLRETSRWRGEGVIHET